MVYGSLDDVTAIVNLETEAATTGLMNVALKRADAIINSRLALNGLNEDVSSSVLEDVGTSIAIAETLQAIFTSTEDANPKTDYYMQQGLDRLEEYIETQSKLQGLNDPYSSSQSPCGNPMKPPWLQWEDLP